MKFCVKNKSKAFNMLIQDGYVTINSETESRKYVANMQGMPYLLLGISMVGNLKLMSISSLILHGVVS